MSIARLHRKKHTEERRHGECFSNSISIVTTLPPPVQLIDAGAITARQAWVP